MTDQTIYFSEEKSEEAVIARMDRARVDPRLHQVVASLVKHLHAFIKDVEPTNEEWMQGIKFLTETG
ncbi:MAG TPA: dioxygenase, partial [Roseiarcus sp.]|nr:dioxygenase [Roseiarcus sp.]